MEYIEMKAASKKAGEAVQAYGQALLACKGNQKEFARQAKELGGVKLLTTGPGTPGHSLVVHGVAFTGRAPDGWTPVKGAESYPVNFYTPPKGSAMEALMKACSMPLAHKQIQDLPKSMCVDNGVLRMVTISSSDTLKIPKSLGVDSLPGFIVSQQAAQRAVAGTAPTFKRH